MTSRRIAFGITVLALVATTAACGGKGTPSGAPTLPEITTGASATPAASPTPAKTTAPPVDPAIVFAADGIGPYELGTTLVSLDAEGKITDIEDSPICPGVKYGTASGGKYTGKLRLVFNTDEKLWYIETDSEDFQTPSGAKVGMSMNDIKTIYGSKGTQIPSGGGSIGGILVPVAGGLAIVFLRGNDGKAFAMAAGPADLVKSFAEGGEGC